MTLCTANPCTARALPKLPPLRPPRSRQVPKVGRDQPGVIVHWGGGLPRARLRRRQLRLPGRERAAEALALRCRSCQIRARLHLLRSGSARLFFNILRKLSLFQLQSLLLLMLHTSWCKVANLLLQPSEASKAAYDATQRLGAPGAGVGLLLQVRITDTLKIASMHEPSEQRAGP